MTQEIILHIGTSKTGSTSLQSAFVRSAKLFEENSIAYPVLLQDDGFVWKAERGLGTGNGDIFMSNPWSMLDPCLRITKLIEQAMNESVSNQRYLFSSENLSIVATEECFWSELSRFIESNQLKVKVVMYLRNPFSYFVSCYVQSVKLAGFTGNLSDYLVPFFQSKTPLTFYVYENIETIQSFASQYGVNLVLQRYEDADGNIVRNFYNNHLGLNAPEFVETDSKLNFTLDPIDIEFHRGINSMSTRLGELIGWQRSDSLYSRLENEPSTLEMCYEFNGHDKAAFEKGISKYALNAKHVLDFSNDIDFSVRHPLVREELTKNQMELNRKVRSLGELMGTAFESGYIAWDRKIGSEISNE